MLNFLTFIFYIYIYVSCCRPRMWLQWPLPFSWIHDFGLQKGQYLNLESLMWLLQKKFVARTYCKIFLLQLRIAKKNRCNRAWWIEWFGPKSPPWPTCCNKICFVIIYFSYFLILGLFSNFRLQWPLPFSWILSFGLQKG